MQGVGTRALRPRAAQDSRDQGRTHETKVPGPEVGHHEDEAGPGAAAAPGLLLAQARGALAQLLYAPGHMDMGATLRHVLLSIPLMRRGEIETELVRFLRIALRDGRRRPIEAYIDAVQWCGPEILQPRQRLNLLMGLAPPVSASGPPLADSFAGSRAGDAWQLARPLPGVQEEPEGAVDDGQGTAPRARYAGKPVLARVCGLLPTGQPTPTVGIPDRFPSQRAPLDAAALSAAAGERAEKLHDRYTSRRCYVRALLDAPGLPLDDKVTAAVAEHDDAGVRRTAAEALLRRGDAGAVAAIVIGIAQSRLPWSERCRLIRLQRVHMPRVVAELERIALASGAKWAANMAADAKMIDDVASGHPLSTSHEADAALLTVSSLSYDGGRWTMHCSAPSPFPELERYRTPAPEALGAAGVYRYDLPGSLLKGKLGSP